MTTDDFATASCVHKEFEQQAKRIPDSTAVVVGETRFSYAEIDGLANGIAKRLHAAGVRGGDRVGLCVQRDRWLIPALLGVMKAGAAYVPLDPAYPEERIRFIAEDASLSAVLTSAGTEHVVPAGARSVSVEDTQPAGSLGLESDPHGPAYVIYTSGSTGMPKGVVVEHRSLHNLIRWFADHLSTDELRGMLATSSVCFDPSTVEICAPLVAGGTVLLAENVFAVPTLPARSEARVLVAAASALSALLRDALPPNVRTVITGGELVTRALCDRVYAHPQVRRVLNFYGPTECTVCCTMAEVDRHGTENPPIGQPMAGAELTVRSPEGDILPEGETGELWIAGPGVSRGYLNRPALTAERFGSFGYRTGDLVRRTGDTYYFVARADEQVKVGGVRLEPGEVEAALAAHPAVRHAVVLAVGDRLVGYAESDSSTEAELRAWLTARLPRHAVPWRIAVLSRIPVHPTGKVDRGALPAITAGRRPDASYTAPRNESEQLVADVVAEILGIGPVGVDDRFADLGGDSLAAARVVSELGRRRRTPVPLATFLNHPTVASLARALETIAAEPPLRRTPGLPRYPLTAMQREFWLLRQLAPDVPVTTLTMHIGVRGPVSGPAVREALDAIVRRHEVMRGTVRFDTEPYLVVGPPVPVPVPEADLRALPADEQRRRLDMLQREVARHTFDYAAEAPLLRAAFARTAEDTGELFVAADHLAFDGASVAVFLRELAGELAGEPVGDPPLQVSDTALHERALDAEPSHHDRLDAFWRTALEGAVIPDDLPGSHEAPGWDTERVTTTLEESLVTRLGRFAAETGTTPFAACLAALGLVTGGLSGHDDLVIGAAAARRFRAGTEQLLGPLVDTLPLRLRMDGELSFRDLVRHCATTTVAALAHQELPARELIDQLPAHRAAAGASRTPVVITMLPFDQPATLSLGAFQLDLRSDRGSGAAANELSVFVSRTATGPELQIEYATRRFARSEMEAFAARLLTTLRTGLADPDLPLAGIELVSRQERAAVLSLAEGPALPKSLPATVVDAVLTSAGTWPESVAVTGPDGSLTYAELDDLSARAASGLLDAGIGPGDVVGVSVPRDRLFPAVLLAVWRAGAAYLPLDPDYPPERLAQLAADGGASAVLARGPAAPGLPAPLDVEKLLACRTGRTLPGARPEDLAYVLYTSGSSGRPKGVEVTHANLVAFVEGFRLALGIAPTDSMAAAAPLSFDVSAEEVWAPLAVGGRCVVVERACATDGYALAERITTSGVTMLNLTPTSMRMLLAAGWPGHPRMPVVTGGEVLDPQLARDLLSRVGQVWNSYGPTETTVTATMHRVTTADDPVPIGRPVAGARCYVVDPLGRLVPPGVTGELWVAGSGVARGYRNMPSTAFMNDPFLPGERCYRTGDRARWRSDGTLEYHGRRDDQVKVRGYRIEPGEIEAALRADPQVTEAAVAVFGSGGDAHLVGYLVPGSVDAAAVQARLRLRLPAHMVPDRWVRMPALPTLTSGKVDRATLPEPSADSGRSHVPPAGEAEEFVAEVWATVLGVSRIWADDHFFALGGHSLAATRVAGRLREALRIPVAVALLFDHPVLADFAAAVEALVLDDVAARSRASDV